MDGGIGIFKFDPRWYHHQTFDHLFPEIATVFPSATYQNRYNPPTDSNANDEGNNVDTHSLPSENGDPTEPSDPLDDHSTDEFPTGTGEEMDPSSQLMPCDQMDPVKMLDDEDKENSTQPMPPVSDKVTYQHIQECSSKLARTCQNDQPKMRTILCNLNRMIERVRDGHDIFITFDDGYIETPLKSNAGDTNRPRNVHYAEKQLKVLYDK
jgi:hypothetical protein